MPIALLKRFFRNVPLRWVLTIPFVLLMLATTVLLGYLSYQSGQEAVEDLGQQLVAQTNERVTQELKSYLQTPLLINRLNVDAVNREQLDLQNVPALEAVLFDRSQQFDQMTAILFVSTQGRLRIVERLPELYSVETDPPRPDKMRVYPLDDRGKRKRLIPTKNPLDVRDRPWYKQAVTTGKLGWGSVAQYGGFEALALTASQPVYDRTSNHLLGVFAVHLRLDYLSQFLNRLNASRSGQVIILDQNDHLIATSTQEKPYKVVGGKGAWKQFEPLKIDESQNALTRSLSEYLRDRALNQSQSLEFNYNGEQHYLKITPFQDQYGLNWRVLTVMPKSQFMGAIQKNTSVTILLCGLALGAVIALGVFAANRFTARFVQLNRASQNLAAGHLDQRLPIDHLIFELNSLSRTFNQMADQLQHAFDRLKTDLIESEEKFTVIFHSSPDPITLVTMSEGRCVEANQSFLELLEYPREALIGQLFLNLGVWNNLEERGRFRQALQQQNHVRNLEVRFVTRTQQIKTVLISAQLIELKGETYSLSTVRDISDRARAEAARKRAEAALQESETRFRQLAETVREGFFVFETESAHYSYVNPAYAAIMGRPFQSFYDGMIHWLNHVHPDDLDRIEAALERESCGENFNEEYRFIRPDGEVRWLRSKAFPLQNETGTLVRVVGTVEDISDVKRREAEREATQRALKQAEERYSLATRAAKVGVWEWDIRTNQIYLDPNIKALIGYSDAEIRNELDHWMTFVHPADRARVLAAGQAYLAGRTLEYELEHRMLHQDGSIVWLLVRGQLIRDQYGNPERLIGTGADITDLKQTEAALRQSETRFQQLASASPSVIYTIVKDPIEPMRFEYVSPAFETLHEVSIAVALQDASLVLEQVHPDDREAYLQVIERSIDTLQAFQHEWRIFTPSGKLKWVQANSQPQRRNDQIVWHGVIQDVTDRKQAEAEIQQLNQQLLDRVHELQTLFNVLPIGVAISDDPECRVARVNPSLSAMLRVALNANASPSAPNVDRPAYRVYRAGEEVPTGDLPMQYAAIHNVEVRDEIVDIVHPDGSIVRLLGYASPLRDEQGKVRGVIGGFVDITERKQIEEALRASEARFRRAFDDAPSGIALISIEGRFLKVNRSLCEMLRYSEAELLTRHLQDMIDANSVQIYLSAMQQLLADESQVFQTEQRYFQKQGSSFQGSLSVSLVKDQANQPLYFIAQIQDISARYQVERMKDEFISIVSHELRTPLTSIRGALGILESGVFHDRPEKAQHMLLVALQNCDRLVRLVNDILTLERLASGKVPLVMEHCQVTELIQQAVNSVQALVDRSGIILSLSPISASLWAAPDAIVQTLTNLLSNAIKFSTSGDTIWLKAEKVTKRSTIDSRLPAPYILFMVKDQGRGIPQDKLEVIFEQFQQVDLSDSRKKGGTGLGLAISKQIVEQHHGQIWVESCLGEGSTFYFALPLIIEGAR